MRRARFGNIANSPCIIIGKKDTRIYKVGLYQPLPEGKCWGLCAVYIHSLCQGADLGAAEERTLSLL